MRRQVRTAIEKLPASEKQANLDTRKTAATNLPKMLHRQPSIQELAAANILCGLTLDVLRGQAWTVDEAIEVERCLVRILFPWAKEGAWPDEPKTSMTRYTGEELVARVQFKAFAQWNNDPTPVSDETVADALRRHSKN